MTPGISPFCCAPARLIWNISPLSAAHSICPARLHRSLLLLFTFHHRQTSIKPPVKRVVTRWSSHSEALLQAALDDVDWDMFRASSSDISEFTNVLSSYVNMLTEQSTETVTIRTFSNQKPWVDRQSMMGLTNALIQCRSFVGKHEQVQSIVLCSLTCSKSR